MIKVITFNNRPDLYDDRYVNATRAMVKRHMSIPHVHWHFSQPKGDSWYIIELFQHAPYLFLALDAVIVGSLDECCNFSGLTAIEEWKIPGEPNTSMMWVADVDDLYEKYVADKENIKEKYPWSMHAEQAWLKKEAKLDFFPKGWGISYKYDGKPKEDTKMVVFHGRPKPHEVKDEWVRENWR